MSIDHYRTLRERVEFRQKIERSEFLGIAVPCVTDELFFTELKFVQKKYFDATHHCWAFRFFAGGEVRERSADAGEPSGTAGKPILSAIEGANLFDTAVVIVRWFGGVKLGTGGLSRAYRDTAAETLKRVVVVDRFVYDRLRVRVPFDMLGVAYRLADPPHVLLAGEEFGEVYEFLFDVRQSRSTEFARLLAEKRFAFTPPRQ